MSLQRHNGLFQMPRGYTAPIALASYPWPYNPPVFSAADFVYAGGTPNHSEPDQYEHVEPVTGKPLCLLGWSNFTRGQDSWMFLNSKSLASAMPGTPRRFKNISADAMYRYPNWWAGELAASIAIIADGVTIWEKTLNMNNGSFFNNNFALDLDVSNAQFFQVGIWQKAFTWTPNTWCENHVANIRITGEYTMTTPPPIHMAEIFVYDSESGYGISNADIRLLDGTKLVTSGKSGSDGRLILNASAGSYQVKVYVSGYTPYPFEATADLTTGDDYVEVPLVKSATPDWMQYVPYIVAGGIGIAGIAGVAYFLKQRRK